MAITTLTELQTAIADRLARSDFTTSQTNECIALTESMMRRDLDTTDMETCKVDFQIYGEFVDQPPNFNSVRSFLLNSSPRRPLPSGATSSRECRSRDRVDRLAA